MIASLPRRLARGGLLAAGWIAFTASVAAVGAGYGGLAAWLGHAPPLEDFERYDPPEATTVLDREGRPYAALFEQRRRVVRLGEMAPMLPECFVAIEDHNFRSHLGVDPRGILRAAVLNAVRRTASQGASTITQQLARNLVDRVGRERSLQRKLREMLVAVQMERAYSKDQILEVYLNQIYLGGGAYGVEAAAQLCFGKSASELDVVEAATLAGLPQRPERFTPVNDPGLARARRDQVLGRMLQLGYLAPPEFDAAILAPEPVPPDRPARGVAGAHFIDALRRELAAMPQLEGTDLQTAGLTIHSTVDPDAQRIAETALAEHLAAIEPEFFPARRKRFEEARSDAAFFEQPEAGQVRMGTVVRRFSRSLVVELPGGWRGDVPVPDAAAAYFSEEAGVVAGAGVDLQVLSLDPAKRLFQARLLPASPLQGAVVVIDNDSGEVLALAGGRAVGGQPLVGSFNRAVQARRQPGSTIKPFFYAAALERGVERGDFVSDTPLEFPNGFAPRNYGGVFRGQITVEQALAHSSNVGVIRLVQRIGLDPALATVARFQRHGAEPWRLPEEWSVVLGASEATPLEMAAAYQALANSGEARGPAFVRRASNSAGRDAGLRASTTPERVLSSAAADTLAAMLHTAITTGTGRGTAELLDPELALRAAGKTGTTNSNRDAWFAGFTPEETIVAWVGFDRPLAMGDGWTGGRTAGPLWARVANELWRRKPAEHRAVLSLPGVPVEAALPEPEPPVPAPDPEAGRVGDGTEPVPSGDAYDEPAAEAPAVEESRPRAIPRPAARW
ncbi:MAG: transglycosylase domain-containing protein [Candidatus Sumerlaeia bacterium]|nr:transglycosylase domain-containing protein [Candidatus Sumerlaeia bacterium]